MICEPCAEAADGTEPRVAECSACDRVPVGVNDPFLPEAEQKVIRHRRWIRPDTGGWCPGSLKPPKFTSGHELCKGCSCHHKPKGSWNHARV